MEQLPTILGALVLAGILWILKGTSENTTKLTVLQSTVDSNILPELKRLRESGHELRDMAQEAISKSDLLEQRTAQSEQDIRSIWNGNDRRSGNERRESA